MLDNEIVEVAKSNGSVCIDETVLKSSNKTSVRSRFGKDPILQPLCIFLLCNKVYISRFKLIIKNCNEKSCLDDKNREDIINLRMHAYIS